ncbi:immunoglobulin-like domain-containing protein [Paenibacillus polymyxa]|uniref:immunoglobulin-like domain-containing protein n=1 Tax=Paenibacillus polymyxa TaxID=1406 RepID=UPI002AB41C71|nr:immunoglobulin-like domain-containing protein [Paenibacillus polymyxa]MDY7991326.1 immunoglobulin-like domain-containing protein [Paenibacillus polymyxa]MDY8117766.1 immunoglobulin-like domain-containing protein [Paenibacillus polymyxa]
MLEGNNFTRNNFKPYRLLVPLLPFIGGAFLLIGTNEVHAASWENVVLNKPATSSGYSQPYDPSRAVDGSIGPTSRWYQASNGEKWIQVDLRDWYIVDRYIVTGMGVHYGWHDQRDPYSFRLQTSSNGSNWVTVDTVQNNGSSNVEKSITPVTTRYLRLYIDQGNARNNQWASIMEFAAYGERLPVPQAPGHFTGTKNGNTVELSWDAVPYATSYKVIRDSVTLYSGNLTQFIDTSALPPGEAIYTVQAVNAKGESTPSEVKVNILTDAERVAQAKAALALGFAPGDTADSVSQKLTLPLAGLNDTTVSWSSDTPDIITNEGAVTRPQYDLGDRKVKLTATIAKGSASDTQTFEVTVAKITAQDTLNQAADTLSLGDLSALTENISLPLSGYGGAQIEWSSSKPLVIAADGTLTRPSYNSGDTDVTLTATLQLAGLTKTKDFTAHVLRLPMSDTEAVDAAYKALELPITTVTGDVYLPKDALNGVQVSWSSNQPQFLDHTGHVTFPSYVQGDQTITLEAVVSRGAVELRKTFSLLVPALPVSADEAVNLAANTLNLDYPQGIKDSIALPRVGAFDTQIDWSSEQPDILSDSGQVNRPKFTDGDVNVQLIAIISKGAASVQRTFTITVLKALPNTPYVRLNGSNPIVLETGDSFTDPGASVLDSVYGNILIPELSGSGNVDTNVPGVYVLNYAYSDNGGWTAEPAERRINVLPRAVTAAAGTEDIASVIVTGALPSARLELYNAQQELIAEGIASGEGRYTFTPVPEGASYYVLQNVNGMKSAPSGLVYPQGLTAQRVADSITSIAAPTTSDTLLRLPVVPDGFRVTISSSSQTDIVRTDGTIIQADTPSVVTIMLDVMRVSDGSHALTQAIEVTVPAKVIANTGKSNKDKNEDVSAFVPQIGFSEQGKEFSLFVPSPAFLDEQIHQALREGKAYADIRLEQEKQLSRVILSHSLLNKWDKIGASVISRYGTLLISSDTLSSMASGQQDVTLSFQQADVQRAQQIRDWAEQQSSLTLMGPVTDIKANVTGTSSIILPLDNESLGELHNTEPQFSILVIHENGEREILKGTAVMNSKGILSGVSLNTTGLGTFAVATDAKTQTNNASVQNDPSNSSDSQGLAQVWPDVQGHWAANSLQSLADKGWIQGYKDGNIRPDRAVSRAEFVTILTRALGTAGDESPSTSFTDMQGHWAGSAVDFAHRQGWIQGLTAQTFAPDESLTREQAMVILSHAMQNQTSISSTAALQSYKDEQQIAAWASAAFQNAVSSGWISGYRDGTLKPKAAISRGEMAELLVRILK